MSSSADRSSSSQAAPRRGAPMRQSVSMAAAAPEDILFAGGETAQDPAAGEDGGWGMPAPLGEQQDAPPGGGLAAALDFGTEVLGAAAIPPARPRQETAPARAAMAAVPELQSRPTGPKDGHSAATTRRPVRPAAPVVPPTAAKPTAAQSVASAPSTPVDLPTPPVAASSGAVRWAASLGCGAMGIVGGLLLVGAGLHPLQGVLTAAVGIVAGSFAWFWLRR